MSGRVYRGIVLPECPPIDKAAAKVMLERAFGVNLPVIQFWNHPSCPVEQLARWEKEDIFPIDLGEEKYHSAGKKSAVQAVTDLFFTELSPAEKRLLEIIAKNNQTGYLKGFSYSVAWIMRELYKLPGYDHREVLDRAAEVVHVWLDTEEAAREFDRYDKNDDELADLLDKVDRKRQFGPFSTGRYIRDLRKMDCGNDQIFHETEFWIAGHDRAKEAIEEGKRKFAAMAKNKFAAGELNGCAIETDDPFVAKAGSYASGVLIVKNSRTGQAAIMTNKADISALAKELQDREGSRWHYQTQQGLLINGGFMYSGLEPTELAMDQLIALVHQYPPRPRPQKQRFHTYKKAPAAAPAAP